MPKNKPLLVRLTSPEHRFLKKYAKKRKQSMAESVRQMVVFYCEPEQPAQTTLLEK